VGGEPPPPRSHPTMRSPGLPIIDPPAAALHRRNLSNVARERGDSSSGRDERRLRPRVDAISIEPVVNSQFRLIRFSGRFLLRESSGLIDRGYVPFLAGYRITNYLIWLPTSR
jgi:hypothetical protein